MPTPREERAAARGQRQDLLQIPNHGLGRADIIRSRSPSPIGLGAFNFPPAPLPVEPDQFQNVEEHDAANNANNMGDQNETIRALTEALAGMKASSRKPELPAFDKNNVEIWVKRVDNAFRRAGITDSKDKFAHIEGKFAVDTDAQKRNGLPLCNISKIATARQKVKELPLSSTASSVKAVYRPRCLPSSWKRSAP